MEAHQTLQIRRRAEKATPIMIFGHAEERCKFAVQRLENIGRDTLVSSVFTIFAVNRREDVSWSLSIDSIDRRDTIEMIRLAGGRRWQRLAGTAGRELPLAIV